MLNSRFVASFLPAFLVAATLSGCHRSTAAATAPTEAQKANARAEMESARNQMEMVPPPSKTRYMAIHTFEQWENPYLTVQPNMLELHVTMADVNPSNVGAGGLLRPAKAREQVVTIAMDKLVEGVTAIPQNSWPYGRVVAIEEAHKTPASAEPAVRRSMEVAIRTLNDIGIVVYDPTEGKLQ